MTATLEDVRNARIKIQQSEAVFAAKMDGNGVKSAGPCPEIWTEIEWAPGHFARQIPLQRNGISIIAWEMPEKCVFPEHFHVQSETFHMVRGRCDLELRNEDNSVTRHKLTPSSAPFTIPKRVHHSAVTHGGSVIVTVYNPSMSIQEVLRAANQ